MRRVALVALSVCTLVGAVLAAPAPAGAAPADVPTAPYTALSLATTGYGNGGGAATALGADAFLRSSATTTQVSVTTAVAPFVTLTLRPPTGRAFTTGDVYSVATTSSATSATATLDRGAIGLGPLSSGSITVREAVAGDAGSLTAFAADLDLSLGSERFVGPLRLASSVGFAGVSLPANVNFGPMKLGQYRDVPVTLTATGTDALPYLDPSTLGGSNPSSFSIVGDDCKGGPLAAGQSCTVTVRARPLSPGGLVATLVLVHDDSTPYEVEVTASADDVADGTYQAISPTRVLDTRNGTGARRGPIGAGGVVHLDVGQYLYGPAGAVVLNLTVDRPLTAGYLTAYPTGQARPKVSSINFPAGWQGANLVTVPIGAGGQIDVYNYVGATQVIADLVGYYASGTGYRGSTGGYHPTSVERLLDTRTWGFGKLPAGYYVTIPVRYTNDKASIGALSVTITAVRPGKQGYLTAWAGDSDVPRTSTLNFNNASGVISNAAIVPVAYNDSECPTCAVIAVSNQSPGPIDLVVDINGFFDNGYLPAGIRYAPLTSPTRIVDTRIAQGTTTLGPAATRTVTAPTEVAGYDTVALDANVTAVTPSTGTYVTVWPTYDDYPRPKASILNPNPKQTIADHAIAEVGYGNRFNLFNAAGTTNLLVDLSGTFEYFPRTPADQIPHQGGDPATSRPAAGAAAAAGGVAVTARNTAGAGPVPHAG